MNKLTILGVAIFSLSAMPALASQGAFTLPGTALPQLREALGPGGVNQLNAQDLHFVYDPSKESLSTWKAETRVREAAVPEYERVRQDGTPIAISGSVAEAIVRGIAQRTQTIHPSLLARERQGRFTISGYDHGATIFFSENFISPSYSSQSANPLSLDICTPHISYLVAVPSYKLEKVEINYCGQSN